MSLPFTKILILVAYPDSRIGMCPRVADTHPNSPPPPTIGACRSFSSVSSVQGRVVVSKYVCSLFLTSGSNTVRSSAYTGSSK